MAHQPKTFNYIEFQISNEAAPLLNARFEFAGRGWLAGWLTWRDAPASEIKDTLQSLREIVEDLQ
jgi:hypothetical protein